MGRRKKGVVCLGRRRICCSVIEHDEQSSNLLLASLYNSGADRTEQRELTFSDVSNFKRKPLGYILE
jgi:hypothetical protein